MRAIVFGATGMVGQGVLRECLLDPGMERVLTVGRSATGQKDAKLRELVHGDLRDYSTVEGELSGYDACFFCLGVTSMGMSEADYRRVTYDIAVAAAGTLVKLNPGMTFIFVSGASTDAKGSAMWARVKGETEDAILAMPFKGAYAFRPAFIQPLHGITSRTASYRVLYAVLSPLYPVLKALFPKKVSTSEAIGRAMLAVARGGYVKRVLENEDINAVAEEADAKSSG